MEKQINFLEAEIPNQEIPTIFCKNFRTLILDMDKILQFHKIINAVYKYI